MGWDTALDDYLLALAVEKHGQEDWTAVATAFRAVRSDFPAQEVAAELKGKFGNLTKRLLLNMAADSTTVAAESLASLLSQLKDQRIDMLQRTIQMTEKRIGDNRKQVSLVEMGKMDTQLMGILPMSYLPPASTWPKPMPKEEKVEEEKAEEDEPDEDDEVEEEVLEDRGSKKVQEEERKRRVGPLLRMLTSVSKHKWAYPFKRPVTDKEAPDYKDIIKNPMDFSTIKKRIENGTVESMPELQTDLNLVFANAMQYNTKGSDYYKMAQTLKEFCKAEFDKWKRTAAKEETEALMIRASKRGKDEPAERGRGNNSKGGRKSTEEDDVVLDTPKSASVKKKVSSKVDSAANQRGRPKRQRTSLKGAGDDDLEDLVG